MKRLAIAFVSLFLLFAQQAAAVSPDEVLSNPRLEARARTIGKELRCLVCQNQSIDDSEAPLAHDLRIVVRQRLLKGDSDQQVTDYIVARYGTYVLLKPPVKPETYLLWFGPLILLISGGTAAFAFFRRRSTVQLTPLSDEEHLELKRLMDEPR
jgi:cytochrome c-type biogenesis protein CcmH